MHSQIFVTNKRCMLLTVANFFRFFPWIYRNYLVFYPCKHHKNPSKIFKRRFFPKLMSQFLNDWWVIWLSIGRKMLLASFFREVVIQWVNWMRKRITSANTRCLLWDQGPFQYWEIYFSTSNWPSYGPMSPGLKLFLKLGRSVWRKYHSRMDRENTLRKKLFLWFKTCWWYSIETQECSDRHFERLSCIVIHLF